MAIAFDLDGTIYFGDQLSLGVLELMSLLQQQKIKVFYFTNNSSRSRKQILEKLLQFGLQVELPYVYSSSYAATVYAKSKNFKKIFCCGTKDFCNQFTEEGLNLVSGNDVADAVFIGLDNEFSYKKLAKVLEVIISSNCPIIACNIDKNYPIEDGKIMPGCGPIVAAIENASERKINFIVGKPNQFMMQMLVNDHQINRDEILVVGDSYESDVMMAKNFGCKSVLISDEEKQGLPTIKFIRDLIKIFS